MSLASPGNLTGRARRNAKSGRLRNFERGRFARGQSPPRPLPRHPKRVGQIS